jgi:hypothetical protein
MVDELTAMFRVCKHIKRDGNRCNSPAMTGMNFCFHHIGGKVASLVREGATYDASAQLDFDYPADRESIQQNLVLVAEALREGKIDNQTANTYIRIFRLCEQNLYRWEKKQKTTGKTKMQPPANEANSDVIPSEAEEPAVSTPAKNLAGGPLKPAFGLSGEQPSNNDVIPSKREARAEEPALPPALTTTDVIPSEREEPAVSTPATNLVIPANPRPKNPKQQYLEDVYYGRIPTPDNLDEILAQL